MIKVFLFLLWVTSSWLHLKWGAVILFNCPIMGTRDTPMLKIHLVYFPHLLYWLYHENKVVKLIVALADKKSC